MIDACPHSSLLWPAVAGEAVDSSVETHIRRCHRCSEQVERLKDDLLSIRAAGAFDVPLDSAEPELPKKIGEFEVLAKLDQGGQADVYRAWHPRLRIDVVVKWYRLTMGRRDEIQHWESNASALSAIRHPNLGQLYDVGVDRGRPFQVMEYVRGDTLQTWIKKFQPTLLRVLKVLSEVGRAVDFVHQQGALHLDLKPGNILIDDSGTPRVIDFGMARTSNGRTLSLTMSPGTPEYMSPEQCAGDGARIGITSDVYGLGAVLFSVLSKEAPRTEELLALEPDWNLIRHAPRPLRKICQRAMAVRPEQRQASALAWSRELDRFVEWQRWSGRFASTAVSLAGVLALGFGIIMFQKSPDSEFHVQVDWKAEPLARPSWQVMATAQTRYKPLWLLMTGGTPPTPIRPDTLSQESFSSETPTWNSEATVEMSRETGPCLLVSYESRDLDIAAINFSRELQAISTSETPLLTAQIGPGEIDWSDTIDHWPSPDRNKLIDTVQRIQKRYTAHLKAFRAVLIIPPRTQ
jgi:serine/threonine protein kinase